VHPAGAAQRHGVRRLPEETPRAAGIAGLALFLAASSEALAGASFESAYPVGETLVYRVKYSGLSAGTATMIVRGREEVSGARAARLEMRTVSSWLASRFVRVDDLATSLVDLSTGGSLRYRFERNEGGRSELEEVVFDRAAGKVRVRRVRPSGEEEMREAELAGAAPVQDALSLFYWLRLAPFAAGETIQATVYEKNRAYPLRLVAEDVERVRVRGLGVFRAIRVRPEAAMSGLFAKEGAAVFWLEESTRVLLRMVIDVRGGSVGMYLVGAERSSLELAPGSLRIRARTPAGAEPPEEAPAESAGDQVQMRPGPGEPAEER